MSLLLQRAAAVPPETGRRSVSPVHLLAAGSALLWLPQLTRPLSPDEGGFLLVASQWSPGTSLYGDYWVDRPPVLIGLFQLADLGGGRTALRLLGLVAVVVSVLLAGAIGRRAAPAVREAPVVAAATAAVLLTTPLFGAIEVDGELLAVPWALAGVLSVLHALDVRARAWAWWALAGALGLGAALVKQSMVEVFVLAGIVLAWLLWRGHSRVALTSAASFCAGAGATLGVVLVWAAAHGTTPAALWDAVVVFRGDAASVISSHANDATPRRALGLLSSLLASGALVLPLAALAPGRKRSARTTGGRPDVRLLTVAVLAWELVAVAGGGSYWLHYLIGTVPGLVLAAVAVAAHRPARTRWVEMALTWSVLVGLAATVGIAVHERGVPTDVAVADYLRDHAQPGDTAVVGFGNPAILENAHLGSPYPELWSLPVRVRDPALTELTQILTGHDRPTWVVVNGATLATWGVDDTRAQPVLDREYQLVDTEGDYHVYRERLPTTG